MEWRLETELPDVLFVYFTRTRYGWPIGNEFDLVRTFKLPRPLRAGDVVGIENRPRDWRGRCRAIIRLNNEWIRDVTANKEPQP